MQKLLIDHRGEKFLFVRQASFCDEGVTLATNGVR
jgi:hypothetical protein